MCSHGADPLNRAEELLCTMADCEYLRHHEEVQIPKEKAAVQCGLGSRREKIQQAPRASSRRSRHKQSTDKGSVVEQNIRQNAAET